MPEADTQPLPAAASPGGRSSNGSRKWSASRLRAAVVDASLSQNWRALLGLVREHRDSALGVMVNGQPVFYLVVLNVTAEDVSVLRELVELGADPNDPTAGDRPLHAAAFVNSAHAVCVLLDAGARINEVSDAGNTPLMVACGMGAAAAARALIRRGANVWFASPQNGQLPMHCINSLKLSGLDAKGVVRALLAAVPRSDRKALLEARDLDGSTPLQDACKISHHDHWRVVKALLDAGADPCSRSAVASWPALFEATFISDIRMTRLLITAGALVDQEDDLGQTALMVAASRGFTAGVQLLLRRGANVHLVAKGGISATKVAYNWEQWETMRVLLKAGGRCPVPVSWDAIPDKQVGSQYVANRDVLVTAKEQRRAMRQRLKSGARKTVNKDVTSVHSVDRERQLGDIPWLLKNSGQLPLPDISFDLSRPANFPRSTRSRRDRRS